MLRNVTKVIELLCDKLTFTKYRVWLLYRCFYSCRSCFQSRYFDEIFSH